MAQLKANYETVMVFSVKNGEESVNALVEKFNTLIADNATINKVDTWGQRTLAYPINDETVGHYVVVEFTYVPRVPRQSLTVSTRLRTGTFLRSPDRCERGSNPGGGSIRTRMVYGYVK